MAVSQNHNGSTGGAPAGAIPSTKAQEVEKSLNSNVLENPSDNNPFVNALLNTGGIKDRVSESKSRATEDLPETPKEIALNQADTELEQENREHLARLKMDATEYQKLLDSTQEAERARISQLRTQLVSDAAPLVSQNGNLAHTSAVAKTSEYIPEITEEQARGIAGFWQFMVGYVAYLKIFQTGDSATWATAIAAKGKVAGVEGTDIHSASRDENWVGGKNSGD